MTRVRPDTRSDRSAGGRHSGESTSDARHRSFETTTRSRISPLACFERSALSVSGIFLLTATKFTDALTTGFGLRYVPGIYEANPLANAAFHRIGIVEGLLWSSFVVVVAITLLTEIAAIAVAARRPDGHLAPVVRIVGYGIPALLFAVVAVYNTTLLIAGIEAATPL
ncbi:hypothetical protein JCM18237_30390 [Halorubrum luteum]